MIGATPIVQTSVPEVSVVPGQGLWCPTTGMFVSDPYMCPSYTQTSATPWYLQWYAVIPAIAIVGILVLGRSRKKVEPTGGNRP